ncbi:probable glycosyltransferase protein [Candidatus Puniceispirillum marinum IMCC1322]|uniref:Probable glycosyltransferase protein n=1 Tax=Puniceispirillum marinum (strain IMCC1322) TaxID=488538 RepID=D5BSH2_PUNMI|nr:probable glycosyltransferase protein [Candidatus Puniceispirillum marinum IMCC1322]
MIELICRLLRKDGVQSDIHVLSDNTKQKLIEVDGTPVTRSIRIGYIATTPFSLNAFRDFRALRTPNSLIHIHSPYPLGEILFLLFGRKMKSVVTYHSDIVGYEFLYFFYKPLQYLFLKKVDVIVATSEKYKESSAVLKKFAPKVKVIPLGISDDWDKVAETELAPKVTEVLMSDYMLFLGALRGYKGLKVLLEAAKKTKSQIIIAGDGPLKEDLERIIKTQSIKNVTLLGAVTEQEKNALLSNCSALVLPSTMRSEAFGIVLLEASAHSKPMISTKLGTGTDLINQHMETGLVVSKKSANDLASAMNFLIDNQHVRLEMGQKARLLFEQKYTAKVMSQHYLDLYKELQN